MPCVYLLAGVAAAWAALSLLCGAPSGCKYNPSPLHKFLSPHTPRPVLT